MEEVMRVFEQLNRAIQPPEFSATPVPTDVAAKVLGMDKETVLNRMESGDLDIGLIFKPMGRKKSGRRSSYISPKKLYELTGYVWKGREV